MDRRKAWRSTVLQRHVTTDWLLITTPGSSRRIPFSVPFCTNKILRLHWKRCSVKSSYLTSLRISITLTRWNLYEHATLKARMLYFVLLTKLETTTQIKAKAGRYNTPEKLYAKMYPPCLLKKVLLKLTRVLMLNNALDLYVLKSKNNQLHIASEL